MKDYKKELAKELIQIAAVAVAALEDLHHGDCDVTRQDGRVTEAILNSVLAERVNQDLKWGPQHHATQSWMVILGEEFGEACTASLRGMSARVAEMDEAAEQIKP